MTLKVGVGLTISAGINNASVRIPQKDRELELHSIPRIYNSLDMPRHQIALFV